MPTGSRAGETLRTTATRAPYFDSAQNAWVVSGYQDVLEALREPALRQDGPQKAPPRLRQEVSSALSQAKLADWEARIEPLAERIIAALPQNGPIELVSEVIRPWSLAVASAVLGLNAARTRRLAALAPDAFTDQTPGPARRSAQNILQAVRRRIARIRLQRLLGSAQMPGVQSLFLGLTQTIPEFLANAWLALLENPAELARLRDAPHLIPKAIEELLRHSGPVHTLVRIADRPVELAGVRIAAGERIILKMGSANRDSEVFADPDALDVGRRSAGHLALGIGPHSCVGAMLVRLAAISATRAFAERLSGAELIDPVIWRRGSTLASPCVLRVRPGSVRDNTAR